MTENNRRFKRFRKKAKVACQWVDRQNRGASYASKIKKGELSNISLNGVCLTVEQSSHASPEIRPAEEQEDAIILNMPIPSESDGVRVLGNVKWLKGNRNSMMPVSIGARILKVSFKEGKWEDAVKSRDWVNYLKTFLTFEASAEHTDADSDRAPRSADEKVSLNSRLAEMIMNVNSLPVRPAIVAESLEIIRSNHSAYKRLSRLIYQTPELVVNIIRVVNSPFYRGVQKIEKLEDAMARLGTDAVKNVIISFATNNSFIKKKGRILTEDRIKVIGEHSLKCAIICDILADRVSQFRRFKENAFLSGAIHDIGKNIILLLLQEIEKQEPGKYAITEDVIERLLRDEHPRVGALLTKLWKFSDPIVEAIHNHHAVTKEIALFSVVKCADAIANRIESGISEEDLALISEVFKGFDIYIEGEDMKELIDYIKENIIQSSPNL